MADVSVTRTPIRVSSAKSSGWRNLVVRVGGGGAASADVELALDGRGYPRNPTVPGARVRPALLAGTELLIADFQSMSQGGLRAAASPAAPGSVPAPVMGRGPSFDCAKAAKPSERLVRSDAGLAALDSKLAAAYAKGVSLSSDWAEPDRGRSRAAQRAWLAERDRCTESADPKGCAESACKRRIAELQIRNGDLAPVPPTVGWRCKGLGGRPVTTVYYNRTDPPSAVITVGDRQVVAFVTRSASGARYATAGVDLWERQGEATLNWYDKSYACKLP